MQLNKQQQANRCPIRHVTRHERSTRINRLLFPHYSLVQKHEIPWFGSRLSRRGFLFHPKRFHFSLLLSRKIQEWSDKTKLVEICCLESGQNISASLCDDNCKRSWLFRSILLQSHFLETIAILVFYQNNHAQQCNYKIKFKFIKNNKNRFQTTFLNFKGSNCSRLIIQVGASLLNFPITLFSHLFYTTKL